MCDLCGNGRTFKGKAGLQVHRRSQHPDVFHAEVVASRSTITKARWSEEEREAIARCELDSLNTGMAKMEQDQLMAAKLGRTADAVKSHRRSKAYKDVLNRLSAEGWNTTEDAGPSHPTQLETELTEMELTESAYCGSSSQTRGQNPPRPRLARAAKAHRPSQSEEEQWHDQLDTWTEEDERWSHDSASGDFRSSIQAWATERLETLPQRARELALSLASGDADSCLSLLEDHLASFSSGTGKISKIQKRPIASSKRAQTRADYSYCQRLYKKRRGRLAAEILNGELEKVGDLEPVDCESQTEYWREIFETAAEEERVPEWDSTPQEELSADSASVLCPVDSHEVAGLLKTLKQTAPGPDGVKYEDLKKLPTEELALIMNAVLFLGSPPESFLVSRTVLIPKVPNPTGPHEFRPISISSVFCRLFHKVLAARLDGVFNLNETQKAFRAVDGCAANIALLDTLLENAKVKRRDLKLAFVDLRKAFDSVGHLAILRNARRLGCPRHLLGYLRQYYESGTTLLNGSRLSLRSGVRQGDPLSPLLFNAVVDEALCKLSRTGYGYELQGHKFQSLAFADDLVLLASSKNGLQQSLDIILGCLSKAGLKPNPAKCRSINILKDGRGKRWVVDSRAFLTIDSQYVEALEPSGIYKYLGLKFSPRGKVQENIDAMVTMLRRLGQAPLKPQQRLFLFRNYAVPRMTHRLVLGRATDGILSKLDATVRNAVRSWVKLPKDTPIGFFHASSEDGGLQIPSFRTLVPRLALARREKLATVHEQDVLAMVSSDTYRRASQRLPSTLVDREHFVKTKEEEKVYWRSCILATLDGRGGSNLAEVPQSNSWVTDGSGLMSGSMYINALKIRGNLWPTRARLSRGTPGGAPLCSAGCRSREALSHIEQSCSRTHTERVLRHDSCVALLLSSLRGKGYKVLYEPRIPTPSGTRVPDLIVWKDSCAHVIDLTVTSDTGVSERVLTTAYEHKVTYYEREREAISTYLASSTDWEVSSLHFGAVVLSWRGALGRRSGNLLKALGVSLADQKLLVVKCLEGGVKQAIVFHRRSTGWKGVRNGERTLAAPPEPQGTGGLP